MAFKDWNGDGKNDMMDNMIEHNFYQQNQKNGPAFPFVESPGCVTAIAVGLVFLLISIFTNN